MQPMPPRAVTAICHALQEQIEHGLLAPGGKLPAERKLSEVFDTTRITLREALAQTLPGKEISIEVSKDAEKLWLYYPSAVDNTDAYLRPSVLIEFGGRNATLPQDRLTIVPDEATYVPELAFPSAEVVVLSPMRTFWEKATLIHVECHRPQMRAGA